MEFVAGSYAPETAPANVDSKNHNLSIDSKEALSMKLSNFVVLAAWLFTFFFFMSFTDNTAQSEFFFCVVVACMVAGFVHFKSTFNEGSK